MADYYQLQEKNMNKPYYLVYAGWYGYWYLEGEEWRIEEFYDAWQWFGQDLELALSIFL